VYIWLSSRQYTGKEVPTLEEDVDARVVELLQLIRRDYIAKDKPMDFARLAGYFTLDILTKIAFGDAIGFLTKNEDLYDYNKASTAFYPIMELGSNHPKILNILNSSIMQRLAAPKAGDKVGLGAIIGVAHGAVAERFAPGAKLTDDMISSFARHGLTREECETESMLQILAGSDSTATALRTTFWYIVTSPTVYAKLLKEIKAAVDSHAASYPVIKHSEAKELPYLQATIKEGLRIFMPLNGLAGRVSPPGGVTVNGVFIPEGTEVGVSVYSMLRRKDIFGVDADTFRPDRWIDNTPETVKSFEKVHDFVFGYGRSSCLGKSIALMELSKALFEVSILCVIYPGKH
jgi:cytochrome P450